MAGLFEVRDNVGSILRLLETSKHHLVALDELFGVLEPLHDVIIGPGYAGLLVGARV